jgi:hypothetical protein
MPTATTATRIVASPSTACLASKAVTRPTRIRPRGALGPVAIRGAPDLPGNHLWQPFEGDC